MKSCMIYLDFDEFQIHILAYYVHSRLHLGLYVAFAYSFAYHRGWIAQMEVWSQNVRLFLCIQDFVADLETNKSPGTNDVNSEYSIGLDCNIKMFGAESRGCFCNYNSFGSSRIYPKGEGPDVQKLQNPPLLHELLPP